MLLTSAVTHADRLINIPQGNKIKFNSIRLEADWDLRSNETGRYAVGYGLTREIEVEWTGLQEWGSETAGSANLCYNFINPITDFAPGFSVGVLDALDRSADRRRGYVSATYRYGLDGENNQDVPMELSIGFTSGEAVRPFVGVSLPFSSKLRLMAEHDGFRVNAAVEVKPMRDLAFRFIVRDSQPAAGVVCSLKF